MPLYVNVRNGSKADYVVGNCYRKIMGIYGDFALPYLWLSA